MDVREVEQTGRGIGAYLAEFSDCFGRCDTEAYLRVYVEGQNSDLQRKSAEPMALRVGVPPRSLQAFLGLLSWDEERMVDRVQEIVVRDHSDPFAIGIVDETGCPKKGRHTATVQRQWCGRTGKIDNCVMSVHTGYVAGKFRCLLDSDLFLPKSWANDPERRKRAGIPPAARHRSKPKMALDQIRRALRNGVRVAAWTFDEHYGESYEFLDGLEALGQTYVAEVPRRFHGWATTPKLLYRATPQEMRQRGSRRRYPRLAKTAAPTSEVADLFRSSPAFRNQPWTVIHIKDGKKGPLVREVKVIRFWMKRQGLPARPCWLIVGRNPLDHEDVKFFVSNASAGCPLEWLVHVAYSRWPIEQCFKEEKDELGFDQFEVRGWRSIHRHMYLTQVSHLYLNKMRERLVGQEQAAERQGFFSRASRRRRSAALPCGKPHPQSDSGCLIGLVPGLSLPTLRPSEAPGGRGPAHQLFAASQCPGPSQSSGDDDQKTPAPWNQPWTDSVVCG